MFSTMSFKSDAGSGSKGVNDIPGFGSGILFISFHSYYSNSSIKRVLNKGDRDQMCWMSGGQCACRDVSERGCCSYYISIDADTDGVIIKSGTREKQILSGSAGG
jgi:hypothetical protein